MTFNNLSQSKGLKIFAAVVIAFLLNVFFALATKTEPAKNMAWSMMWVYVTIEAWKYWKWKALLPYPCFVLVAAVVGASGFSLMAVVLNICGLAVFSWLPQAQAKKQPPNHEQNTTAETESISESDIYQAINEEMARKDYNKELAAKAFAEAKGDKAAAKNLYIKFRYEELFAQRELERKEKQRQQQMDIEFSEEEKRRTRNSKWWMPNREMVIGIIAYFEELFAQRELERKEKQRQQQMDIEFSEEEKQRQMDTKFSKSDVFWGSIFLIWGVLWLIDKLEHKSQPPVIASPTPTPSVPQNVVATVEQIHEAAKQGDVAAQSKLGDMYYYGFEIAIDRIQAVTWYRKAAEQGNASAQVNLGGMYRIGEGVAQDNTQAVAWFRKAAEQGDASAQVRLGTMYFNGLGVAKDEAQTVAWYRKAAEQGNVGAQISLGGMYERGEGVAKDDAQAVVWYRKVVEQENAHGQDVFKRTAKEALKRIQEEQTASKRVQDEQSALKRNEEIARSTQYCEELFGNDRAGFQTCLDEQVAAISKSVPVTTSP